MNEDNFASDYLPEPPTPTSRAFPLGELIILVSLNRWNSVFLIIVLKSLHASLSD